MRYLPVFLATEFAYETWGEKFALSGRMILTGMGTVFFVLLVLWGVIAIFGAVAKAEQKRENKRIMEEVKNSPAPYDQKAADTTEAPADVTETAEDDGALIAVITAAIEAYRSAEGLSNTSYRVVSFKRKNTKKSWNGLADD